MKSKYLTHSGNWSGFLTIQGPSCPTVPQLSTITENATIEEQVLWGHTTCREGLVYCSHITVTSTPLDGNTTPRPHWAAISVFPPGLGLDTSCLLISHSQTKHLYDTLYYLLMGEVRRRGHGWTHCLTYMQERRMEGKVVCPLVWWQKQETAYRQESGVLNLGSFYASVSCLWNGNQCGLFQRGIMRNKMDTIFSMIKSIHFSFSLGSTGQSHWLDFLSGYNLKLVSRWKYNRVVGAKAYPQGICNYNRKT